MTSQKNICDSERVIALSEDGFLRADNDGYIITANNAIAAMCGYSSPNEVIGLYMSELYANPKDRDRIVSAIKTKGKLLNYELELRRKDGSYFWSLSNIKTFSDEKENLTGTESVIRDISKQKQTEEKLERANNVLAAVRKVNQLITKEKELRASNLQLGTNEEELRAANQQLQAYAEQLKANETELISTNKELNERLKEISCLYHISNIIETYENAEDIIKESVEVIPPSWQYPEDTAARITYRKKSFTSHNFRETQWKQEAPVMVNNKGQGLVEVFYLKEKPTLDEGPFLKEERSLINAVAKFLGKAIENINKNEMLQAANQQLRASEQQLRAANQQLSASEEALRQNQNRLIEAQRIAKVGDFTWNVNTGEVTWSEALYDILGFDKSEKIEYAKINKDIHHPEDLERVNNWLNESIESGKEVLTPNEYRLIRKDGKTIHVHVEGAIERYSGHVTVFSTLQDITERKKLESELRVQYELSENLINTAQVAILMLDTAGNIVRFNAFFEKLTGYRLEEVKGKDWFDTFIEEGNRNSIRELFHQAIDDIHTKGNVNTILAKDGKEIPVEWYDKTLKDNNNKSIGLLAIGLDVSERLKAEKELRKYDWLTEVEKTQQQPSEYMPEYGNVVELNTERTILDSVGEDMIRVLGENLMALLDTSVAVYERNGDYAFGMFASSWCQTMDASSRNLCRTKDNKKALTCGKWLCHENCWNESAKTAIESGKPTDIDCIGGIKLYAEPIIAGDEIVGSINMGYGTPPSDDKTLKELAEDFNMDFNALKNKAKQYKPRPHFIENVAKKHLKSAALLLGNMVQRKKIKESLEASEAKFRSYINHAPDGIFITDENGRYVDVNVAASSITGYSREELLNSSISDLLHPDYIDAGIKSFQELGKKGSIKYDLGFVTKSGENRYWEVSAVKLSATRFLGFTKDITERKVAVEALKESESSLRDAQRIANIGNWSFDFKTGRIYMSDEMYHLIGIKDEKEGANVDQHEKYYTQESWQKFQKALKEVTENGESYELELEFANKKAKFRYAIARGEAVHDENNKIIALNGTLQDITKRRKAEKDLMESEERLKLIINESPFPVVVADMNDDEILYWSKSAQELTGYSPKKVSEWYELAYPDPEYRKQVIERWNPFLEKAKQSNNTINTGEYQIKCNDGSIKYVEFYIQIIPRNMVVTIHDITERKKAASNLEEKFDHLRRLNRAMTGREDRMVELKQQINELSKELSKKPPFKLDFLHQIDDPSSEKNEIRDKK